MPLGKNPYVKIIIKPMLYKIAYSTKSDYWLTCFDEKKDDIKDFQAFKNVYFPLNQTDDEFFAKWRCIIESTYLRLETAKKKARNPDAVDDVEVINTKEPVQETEPDQSEVAQDEPDTTADVSTNVTEDSSLNETPEE